MLLVEGVFPEQPLRQRLLSVAYPLRYLFASRPECMGHVLGIVYRRITMHLIATGRFARATAYTGAVTLIDGARPCAQAPVVQVAILPVGHMFGAFQQRALFIDEPDNYFRFGR